MARIPINTGSLSNDGTGTQNRTAWQNVNLMFQEVYANLESLVTSVAASAALTQIIRTDAAQTLTAAQKLRAARNAGTLLPLMAELVPPTTALTAGAIFAFTLPQGFILYDTTLTVRDFETGATVAAALQKQESNNSWTTLHSVAGNIGGRRISLGTTEGGISIAAGAPLRVNVTSAVDGYAGNTFGLAVCLRGVWA